MRTDPTSSDSMPLRSIALCLKPGQPQASGLVRGLDKWLRERGLAVGLDEEAGEQVGRPGRPREALIAEVDGVVALGGDGTLLAVARAAGERAVPILGVNLGTLGFMAEIPQDEMFAALERVLRGEMRVEPRMRLEVTIRSGDEIRGRFLALNDAVVANGDFPRMIEVRARVDDMELATYHADGLIVSTPTGSTAYSLSAGGPVLDPRLEAMVVTPISPHTLTQRPVVLPGASQVEIRARVRGGHVQLAVDGQVGGVLGEDDFVTLRCSPHRVHLVVSPFRNHFAIVREKLGWGRR